MERWRPDPQSDRRLHYFSIPGGQIEPGETAEQAAVRELREEMQVEIEIIARVAERSLQEGGSEVYFYAHHISGEPQLSDASPEAQESLVENSQYEPRWISIDDISAAVLQPFYGVLGPIIAQLARGDVPARPWQLPPLPGIIEKR